MNLRVRFQDKWRALLQALGYNVYLCRNCKLNDPRYCRHRVRPRATICEDFRRR
jgi:hypothetical protein